MKKLLEVLEEDHLFTCTETRVFQNVIFSSHFSSSVHLGSHTIDQVMAVNLNVCWGHSRWFSTVRSMDQF